MNPVFARPQGELARIGEHLRELADQVDALAPAENRAFGQVPTYTLQQALRTHLKARRDRDDLPGADLFADPAWDLLLDLLLCHLEQRRVSISSACLAAAVPQTTALRWIAQLEARGLILRTADPNDRRRSYLQLAPATREALLAWVRQHLPPVNGIEPAPPASLMFER